MALKRHMTWAFACPSDSMLIRTSPLLMPCCWRYERTVSTTPPWFLATPLGIPVVPDVNMHLSISCVVTSTPVLSLENLSNDENGSVFMPPISAGTAAASPVMNITSRPFKSFAISSINGTLPGSITSAFISE